MQPLHWPSAFLLPGLGWRVVLEQSNRLFHDETKEKKKTNLTQLETSGTHVDLEITRGCDGDIANLNA